MPGSDTTEYYLDDLHSRVLDSKSADGKNIRSFLFAAENLRRKSARATLLVKKPGPLPDDEIGRYADVYQRGMDEVSKLLDGVRVKHVSR